ncbi:unnamed protein product [Bursaphelenchus xylophilus]|uniref:(pine wood nematode) hypothetical protein n=1 Tax=Bursaphelenchus xylophilus TaxID=6326 RepID=A0A1I7SA51_BURXY|nr:unnamed protein product [Bursaphelenchus xylophilus]CAG9131821.1 unnamed protein product [Bursaphelenchus xylophilus]
MFMWSVTVLLALIVAGNALENEKNVSVGLVLDNEKEGMPLNTIEKPEETAETLELDLPGFEGSTIHVKLVEDDLLEMKWKHILCKPCRHLFKALRKELNDGAGLTKEKLKKAIHHKCKEFGGLVAKVCNKLGRKAVDALYDSIVKEDMKIHPRHCCKKIGLCK